MMGAGAVAGTLSGGNTNAALSPAPPPPTEVARAVDEAAVTPASVNTVVIRQQRPELAPAAVVAMRFPPRWQQAVAAEPSVPDSHAAMAFAAMPQPRTARTAAPAEAQGFQLASVDPAPAPMPKRVARPKQKNDVLFNDAQLASIKARLRLTRDQEQYWPQVEQALRAISWKIATQQNAKRPVRGSQAAMIDPNSPEVARLKSAAFPLIMSMREDQKQEVRQLAHTMGLRNVATMF